MSKCPEAADPLLCSTTLFETASYFAKAKDKVLLLTLSDCAHTVGFKVKVFLKKQTYNVVA